MWIISDILTGLVIRKGFGKLLTTSALDYRLTPQIPRYAWQCWDMAESGWRFIEAGKKLIRMIRQDLWADLAPTLN
jgi:hypothetical protein